MVVLLKLRVDNSQFVDVARRHTDEKGIVVASVVQYVEQTPGMPDHAANRRSSKLGVDNRKAHLKLKRLEIEGAFELCKRGVRPFEGDHKISPLRLRQ